LVLNLAHYRLLRKTPGRPDPNAILYDARPPLIYVAQYDGKTAASLDPPSGGMVAIMALGGEPEYCQADPDSGLVYQSSRPVR
jgi:hypothetical protein